MAIRCSYVSSTLRSIGQALHGANAPCVPAFTVHALFACDLVLFSSSFLYATYRPRPQSHTLTPIILPRLPCHLRRSFQSQPVKVITPRGHSNHATKIRTSSCFLQFALARIACEARGVTLEATFPCKQASCPSQIPFRYNLDHPIAYTLAIKAVQPTLPDTDHWFICFPHKRNCTINSTRPHKNENRITKQGT